MAHAELIAELLTQSKEVGSAWKFFVQDSHERIEHFRANCFVDIRVLLVVHLIVRAASKTRLEYLFRELPNFLLVIHAISVVDVLALLVLVQAFALFGSLLHARQGA